MKFEAITIKDIARALGLSTSTVSRALRDSYEISDETKKLVLDYAEKNHYKPNPIALSLKERKSRSIGVVVCEIANGFFSQVINGVESIASKNGYNVIIAQSMESFERELVSLQFLTSRSIDGLIMSVSTETKDFDYLKNLNQKGLPLVFFDRIVDEIDTHKVIADNYYGAYKAACHLLENGYRRIAAIANMEFLSITKQRLAGYQAALESFGVAYDPSIIKHCYHGGMVQSEVEDAVTALLELDKKPDSILAISDRLTTGCLRILKAKGIRIPERMGLVGFSNTDLTELLDPALSVIRQPAFEMGEKAMQHLLHLIESKRPVTEFETTMLSTDLLVRESSVKKSKR